MPLVKSAATIEAKGFWGACRGVQKDANGMDMDD